MRETQRDETAAYTLTDSQVRAVEERQNESWTDEKRKKMRASLWYEKDEPGTIWGELKKEERKKAKSTKMRKKRLKLG